MSEILLAKKVLPFLTGKGYEIYQEVTVNGFTIDLVCRKDDKIHSIECKLNLNLDVLYQAHRNRNYSHFSSICVPFAKNTDGRIFAKRVCKEFGIGIIQVSEFNAVDFFLQPRENTDIVSLPTLYEQSKTYAEAGTNSGKSWTSFQNTIDLLSKYVAKHDGCGLSEALQAIEHHYASLASAKSSIRKRIKQGIIRTVYVDDNDKLFTKIDTRHMSEEELTNHMKLRTFQLPK